MTMLALLSSIEVAFTRRGVRMRRSFAAITALACLVAPASVLAENAYITNLVSANVSVIATATNTVIATIPVGIGQNGLAVTPDGSKVYVTNVNVPFVSVIDTGTNTVIATIFVGGLSPFGVAVTPDGSKVYVTDASRLGHVSVIDTGTNTVIATIPVGEGPRGVAVTPDGSKVYVTNVELPPNPPVVSVIATATNTVIATIPLGGESNGVAVTPDGRKVYVANSGSNNVFVIDTATNAVIGSPIPVGLFPFGVAVTPDGDRHAGKDEKEAQHGEAERDRHRRAGEHEGGKVYVANRDNDNVSVIATATNGDCHDPRRLLSPRRRGHPRRQKGLCRELRLEQCVRDRHGEQLGARGGLCRHSARCVRCVHPAAGAVAAGAVCWDASGTRLSGQKCLSAG